MAYYCVDIALLQFAFCYFILLSVAFILYYRFWHFWEIVLHKLLVHFASYALDFAN